MKKQETEKTDKSERENHMRAAIKKAAFHLMAEKGLDKVSMREIAEKVNELLGVEEDDDMTQERFNEMMDNYMKERAELEPSKWSA